MRPLAHTPAMDVMLTIHFALAWLVAICAVFFSWNALGRRVMNAVLGLQVLAGLIVAGLLGASHAPMPPLLIGHVLLGFAALIAYAVARRLGDRPGGAGRALIASIVGLLCIASAIYLGLHMTGQV